MNEMERRVAEVLAEVRPDPSDISARTDWEDMMTGAAEGVQFPHYTEFIERCYQ